MARSGDFSELFMVVFISSQTQIFTVVQGGDAAFKTFMRKIAVSLDTAPRTTENNNTCRQDPLVLSDDIISI